MSAGARIRATCMLCAGILLGLNQEALGYDEEKTLIQKLMDGYNQDARPVKNSTGTVNVAIDLSLHQIIEMSAKKQVLTTSVWQRMYWRDEHLAWDPKEYGGLDKIRLSADKIWKPDIALVNEVKSESRELLLAYPVVVTSEGDVGWYTPRLLHTSCSLDMTNFPWDTQKCILQFSSWTHDDGELSLSNKTATGDLSILIPDGEWDLLSFPLRTFYQYVPCCKYPFTFLDFEIHVQRKVRYYIANIIFPSALITAAGMLVFCLPTESGEKVSLSVTILLATTVFQLVLTDSMPVQSLSTPIIERYIMCTQILLGLSTVLTVFIINVSHKGSMGHGVPRWLKVIVTVLAHIFCMRKQTKEIWPKNEYEKQKQLTVYLEGSKRSSRDLNKPVSGTVLTDGDSQKDDYTPIMYPFVRKIAAATEKLDTALTAKEAEDSRKLEWIFVSIVLDRLFLFTFGLAMCISSLMVILGSGHYRTQ